MSTTYDDQLTELFANKMSLPFLYPIPVKIWQCAKHVLIPKSEYPTLDKLRNIQIIESDYNTYFNIKINKQLLRHKYPQKILTNQTVGGLRDRTTHMALLTQTLINYNMMMNKTTGYVSQSDVSNCYDLMTPNLVPMSLTRLGTPKSIETQIAMNSMNTKHRIQAYDGLSQEHIHCPDSQIWSGTGKGNSVSGPGWLSLEAPMIEIMQKENIVCLTSPLSSLQFTNATTQTLEPEASDTRLYQKTKKEKEWKSLLQASGGKLSTHKCHTQAVRWVRKENNLSPHSINTEQNTQELNDLQIPIHPPETTIKYLGLHMNILGNFKKELVIQKENALSFSKSMA